MIQEESSDYAPHCHNCGELLCQSDMHAFLDGETLYHTRDWEPLCIACGKQNLKDEFFEKWGVEQPAAWDNMSAMDKLLWESLRKNEALQKLLEATTQTSHSIAQELKQKETPMSGNVVVMYVPAEYFEKRASEDEKKCLEFLGVCAQEIAEGKRSHLVLPLLYDAQGNKRFDLEILSVPREPVTEELAEIRELLGAIQERVGQVAAEAEGIRNWTFKH
jgi:5-hydroxyisourate hydrolase-like protein (transthyretin family)